MRFAVNFVFFCSCSPGYAYRSSLNTCEECANSAFDPVVLIGPLVILCVFVAISLFGYRYFKDGKDYQTKVCQFLIKIRCLQLLRGGTLKGQFESFKIKLTARVKVILAACLYYIVYIVC